MMVESATNKIASQRLEVFVQSGLDILLTVHGPLDSAAVFSDSFEDPIVKESIDVFKETESESQTFEIEFKAKSPGTYAFCLDNRSARFLSKSVQALFLYDFKIISKGINKIQKQQLRDRRRLSLHSDTNNATYNELFAVSIVETFIFVCVSVLQMFFVRRWFVSRNISKVKSRA
eukprot:gene26811-35148_t